MEAKAILVTGASTGIGRQVTERLAAAGHFVYAGARKHSDLHGLAAIKNVRAIQLDVTSLHDITLAVEAIEKGGCGLYGLVNNAGILTLGSVVDGSDREFDLVMAVNVRGAYQVTRAFAPLIISGKGRVVMISSVAGLVASKNASAYSMSKHAVEAFTDSLALEMETLGVQVSVVEPGSFNTEIAKNAIGRVGTDSLLPDFSKFKQPDDVAEAITLALLEPKPKRRYLVVANEEEAQIAIKNRISQLVQLNEGHRYTYDRHALIRMLDEALVKSRPGIPRAATTIDF